MSAAQVHCQGGVQLIDAGSVILAVGFERPNNPCLSYSGLHSWVTRLKGRPTHCVDCGSADNVEWSNQSGFYTRNPADYLGRCRPCHRHYDQQERMRGAIRRKWGES